MYKKEIKKVITEKEVIISVICDNCGNQHQVEELPEGWHEFEGHHYEWGNESCESVEKYIACSPECYIKLLEKSVNNFAEYRTAVIDGFNIGFAKTLIKKINLK